MRQVTLVDRSDYVQALRARLELDPARTAVLAVDVHRGHLDPAVATMPVQAERAQRVVAALGRLFQAARRAGVPIIYVTMNHRRLPYPGAESMVNPFWRAVEEARQSLTPDRPSTIRGHNLEGSEQVTFLPEIAPQPGDYRIDNKKRLSAFYGTDLDVLLRVLKVETTVIVGINTNTCVLCTAFEAFNRDLRVVVVPECVDSMYGEDLHVFGLENVARCLGWVVGLEELERLLTRT
ncbi:MAG TPA: cysteine hydrolase [Limnochordales bacterium]